MADQNLEGINLSECIDFYKAGSLTVKAIDNEAFALIKEKWNTNSGEKLDPQRVVLTKKSLTDLRDKLTMQKTSIDAQIDKIDQFIDVVDDVLKPSE